MSHLDTLTADLDRRLAAADEQLATLYPGDRGVRQPVHTVYVPADRFTNDLNQEWGRQAAAALAEHGGTPAEFAAAIGADPAEIEAVYARVVDKLEREPIEDLRIDFEDGYGPRPDDEEDAAAISAARALRRAVDARDGTAVCRHPVQELRAADPATRTAGPWTCSSVNWPEPAACRRVSWSPCRR